MKAAAAVLGASMLFFLGVLTGVGRREAVPPPAAIPLGAVNTPSASGTSTPSSPGEAPKRSTTTTATSAPSPATPSAPAGTTGTTRATVPNASATTASTAPSSPSTTRSGEVEQVDNQVDCRSERRQGKGKREPCPSTTTSTGEAPRGGNNP